MFRRGVISPKILIRCTQIQLQCTPRSNSQTRSHSKIQATPTQLSRDPKQQTYIRNDTVDFPTSFCRAYRRAMCKVQEAAVKKIAYRCMVKPYNWLQHCSGNIYTHNVTLIYQVCIPVLPTLVIIFTTQEPTQQKLAPLTCKGGNPQKPGRQPGITPNALLDYINTTAPPN